MPNLGQNLASNLGGLFQRSAPPSVDERRVDLGMQVPSSASPQRGGLQGRVDRMRGAVAGPQQDSSLALLAARARGQGVSPLELQQRMAMEQLLQSQAGVAGGVRAGVNPAMAQALAARQGAQAGMGNIGQLGQARMQEQTAARQALINAQLAQRQQQLRQNLVMNALQRQMAAAELAQSGAQRAGMAGLGGGIASGLLSKFGGG